MKATRLAAAIAVLFTSAGVAHANPLAGQYTVASSATHIAGDTWRFDYTVTNVDQYNGGRTGWDGFLILVPDSAVLVSHTVPASYYGFPGYWSMGEGADYSAFATLGVSPPAGYHWMTWWGNDPASVYPAGKGASFSVTLDNVKPAENTGGPATYWAFSYPTFVSYDQNAYGQYTFYTTALTSPAPVPEPETYALMLAVLGVLGAIRRRKA